MGRIIITVALVILMMCVFGISTAFADGQNPFKIEQVYALLPNVNVYFYAFGTQSNMPLTDFETDPSKVSVSLGDEILKINSVMPLSQADIGTRYIFLLDVSGSINSVFNKVKQQLIAFAGKMSAKDKMILITFGTTPSVVLDGTQTGAEITQDIQNIKGDSSQTHFYDAIGKALDMSAIQGSGLPDRRVLIAITDGHDINSGGGNTKDTISKKLSDANLPMYALGIKNKKSDLTGLSDLADGNIKNIDSSNVDSGFEWLSSYLNSCYVVSASSATNITDGTAKELTLKIQRQDGKWVSANASVIPASAPDTTKPEFTAKATGNSEITVTYSENVSGADNASDYDISSLDGTKIAINKAAYDQSNNTAILTLSDTIYDGTYTVKLLNISDVSMEKNSLKANSLQLTVSGHGSKPAPSSAPVQTTEATKKASFLEQYWWALVIAAALLILLIILLVVLTGRKKKLAEQAAMQEEGSDIGLKHHIKSQEGRKIKLTISDPNGLERVLEVFVKNRLTIGRSDTCDIYFDDTELSRRHAEIVYKDGELLIEDLGSTNGTLVNGVRISTGRKLGSGDIIEMGQVKIIVSI